MKIVNKFTVISAAREPVPSVNIMCDGCKSILRINATQIIAQFETSWSDILLILDEDCPYEEALHFVLIRGDEIIDHITIGGIYQSGFFNAISHELNTLQFTFGSDLIYALLLDQSGSIWPRSLPSGAVRKTGWFAPHFMRLKEGPISNG